ncbi:hypothetical protein Prudu_106S000100 [Prunus dulcis]|uniref:Uncharacterized protein n=1 Tax=Prunus dulcis TaxID=3755 RepID=A0A5H2XKK0_PRUDU|nr:hypothetical protein Prudu_106S000100 [Prunus dulcis]
MESVIYTCLDSLMDYEIQGWLDAHLRGSKSSFSSYINGSTGNFQEGLSMSVDKRDFTFTKELHEKLTLNFFPIRSCLLNRLGNEASIFGLKNEVVQGEEKPHPTRFPMKNKFETLMCKSYTGVGDHFEPMDFPRYQKKMEVKQWTYVKNEKQRKCIIRFCLKRNKLL